ncbi:hypothetical protein NDU88_008287 [Pleurodeles waltl]|uniref:Uncharacterized protein n=1 Tax=Pleurodeles waltl TaxID=8319 RepID=A0AAV7NYJ5_PLEWA|nr:hypothetical protein NDU88_008287 [Pleurodeles waltl]
MTLLTGKETSYLFLPRLRRAPHSSLIKKGSRTLCIATPAELVRGSRHAPEAPETLAAGNATKNTLHNLELESMKAVSGEEAYFELCY